MTLLKYPGGKETELKHILPRLPSFTNYYEPFVGGGAVFFAVEARRYFINDKSEDLMNLYACVKQTDADFFACMEAIDRSWRTLAQTAQDDCSTVMELYKSYRTNRRENTLAEGIDGYTARHKRRWNACLPPQLTYQTDVFTNEMRKNLLRKLRRMEKLEREHGLLPRKDALDTVECAFKSAFYMYMRHLLNHGAQPPFSTGSRAAVYLFIRETCYSSMFRYNARGEFNVPYGGISYNAKNFSGRLAQYRNADLAHRLSKTQLSCGDFLTFLTKHSVAADDFIFVDPPYDTEFSTYDRNRFDDESQKKLARYLITECTGSFMLVIKSTPFIRSLYPQGVICANKHALCIDRFDKNYLVSFKNRNDKAATHLVITNYQTAEPTKAPRTRIPSD